MTGVSAGSKIAVSCTGLAPLHPYMLVGTSLVRAVDPAAAPLLSGQLTSLSGLMALLTALKEIDPPSAITPISGLTGNLSVDWTVPRYQPLDPNATLSTLQSALGTGAGSPPIVKVTLVDNGKSVPASSHAQVTPATYNRGVFAPPVLSGSFTVPTAVTGPVTVDVQLTAALDGIPVTNTASAPLSVSPPTTS